MVGKLVKWVLIVVLLASVVWHYRDTGAVRERRSAIESLLSTVGMDAAFVRRYWPLEGPAGQGSASPDAAPAASPPSAAPSVWNDFVTRFNPITLLRDRLDAQKPATTP